MTSPRVSVVMSVLDGERHVREAVESILRQTFRDLELVAVDDGSADGTATILESYSDPRLRLVRNPETIGQAASLNRGLDVARGALIARHDADDVAEPTRLERQVAFLDAHATTAAAGTAWVVIDDEGRREDVRVPPLDCLSVRWRLLFSNAFLHSSMLVRRDVFDRIGRYDETIEYGEDFALWSRLAREFEVANLAEPLVRYRHSSGSKTSTVQDAQVQVDAIAGDNVDRVAGAREWGGFPSTASFAAAARTLLFSSNTAVEPAEALRAAECILDLQRHFARFFDLPPRVARGHRARLTAVLGSRLRAVGRVRGDRRAVRTGLRLLAVATSARPSLLVRRNVVV